MWKYFAGGRLRRGAGFFVIFDNSPAKPDFFTSRLGLPVYLPETPAQRMLKAASLTGRPILMQSEPIIGSADEA